MQSVDFKLNEEHVEICITLCHLVKTAVSHAFNDRTVMREELQSYYTGKNKVYVTFTSINLELLQNAMPVHKSRVSEFRCYV